MSVASVIGGCVLDVVEYPLHAPVGVHGYDYLFLSWMLISFDSHDVVALIVVNGTGLEPVSSASEAEILSIELSVQSPLPRRASGTDIMKKAFTDGISDVSFVSHH